MTGAGCVCEPDGEYVGVMMQPMKRKKATKNFKNETNDGGRVTPRGRCHNATIETIKNLKENLQG